MKVPACRRPVLFVGEAPGRVGSKLADGLPFDPRTRAGARLARLAGVTSVPEAFGAVNLLARWPGGDGKGSAFPIARARRDAEALLATFPADVRLILVGRRVAAAFGVRADYLRWVVLSPPGRSSLWVAVLPHPSGNRWWNDPANLARARRFLRAAARAAA